MKSATRHRIDPVGHILEDFLYKPAAASLPRVNIAYEPCYRTILYKSCGEAYKRPPRAATLDIDDTPDVVHGEAGQGSSGEADGIARRGHQQMSLFNAHYDERCFLPIHVYDTATARPVALLLRPGAPPSGAEIRNHLRRLIRRIAFAAACPEALLFRGIARSLQPTGP
jgi:Transposase DDE domain group 1